MLSALASREKAEIFGVGDAETRRTFDPFAPELFGAPVEWSETAEIMYDTELRAQSRVSAVLHPHGPGLRTSGVGATGARRRRPGFAFAGWDDRRRRESRQLQHVLRAGDGVAVFVGFAVPLLLVAAYGPPGPIEALAQAAMLVIVGMWSIRFHGLWSPQVTSVRSIELSKLFRAVITVSALALVLDRKASTDLRMINVVVAGVTGLIALLLWRSAFRAYLNAERRRGRFLSRVAVVGTGRHAAELARLFIVHPELGMRLTTVVGAKQEAMAAGMARHWKGEYDEALAVLSSHHVDVVVLCSSELDRWQLNELSAASRQLGRALYVDPGLSGIDFKRVHTTSIGYHPMLEMSGATLSGLQTVVKRVFDVVVAAIVGVIAAPIAIAVAAMIKLEDGGPILFKQERVGRDGTRFAMIKFRTMVVDAEAKLAELEAANERRGPLFKMEHDPRITRIGRFLRATSLDEIPQLLNVFNGTMSLVGPRPALPREVAAFPDELHARHQVRPGITGLWQVEARDNPSFEAYIRLDLYYVQNWSLPLDLLILLGTADHIFLRPLFKLMYRREDKRRAELAGSVDHVAVAS